MILKFLHQTKEQKISAYLKRGNEFYLQKKFAKAIPYYKKILNLDSNHYGAIINLAVCLLETQKYHRAVPYFIKAAKMDSNNAWTYNYLSQCYQKEEDFSAALAAAWKAVEVSEDDDNHHLNLAYTIYETATEKGKDFVDSVLQKWYQKCSENPIAKQCYFSFFSDAKFAKSEPEYIEKLFDVFAEDFDDVLGELEYDSPRIIAEYLQRIPELKNSRKYEILDLGCGTGLCGRELKKIYKKSEITGVDISAQMLAQATGKKSYKNLIKSDIESYLDSTPENQFNIVVMSDVLTYFGEIKNIVKGVQKILQNKGVFVFTFSENFTNKNRWFLMPSSRFVHSPKYIENTLISSGFEILKMSSKVLRKEGEKNVVGQIVLALKK